MAAGALSKVRGIYGSPLNAAPPEIERLSGGDVIAIGFTKNDEGAIGFSAPAGIITKLETFFELDLIDEINFFGPTGKAGELFEIPVLGEGADTDRLYLVGVGDLSTAAHRIAGAALGRRVRGKAIHLVSVVAHKKSDLRAHAISLVLGAYIWNQKTGATPELPIFSLVTEDETVISQAATIASAVCRARDLIHTPSNIKTPLWLAQEATNIAHETGLGITVLAGKELIEFGGLRAVGNSSPHPGPRFIEVRYAPQGSAKTSGALPHVVIVGKGITFDTGGISLKRPYDTMTAMKSDMAGAAAALAVISALPELQPQVRVTVLMMCAENALSATSQRPSDVITQYGGTTVEVINTDAEGRLVLADGLAYADINLDPDYLVDIATLTGAATLGLGRQYGAMYTRDHELAKSLVEIGEQSGDQIWHMPLVDDYKDALESDIADLNHTAKNKGYSAGSVTAALFLEHFVGDRRWVHLDIAGTARSESDAGENPKGGTGFGVRLLIDWITSL